MFLFGRRKMLFGKRHVPTEPIKVVQLPNTCIGGFISQSACQRRTVTTNFLSVRHFTDITDNCWARGLRAFASVRGMARLRDDDVSKLCVAFIFNIMASKDFTTSKMNVCNSQENLIFSTVSSDKTRNILVDLGK